MFISRRQVVMFRHEQKKHALLFNTILYWYPDRLQYPTVSDDCRWWKRTISETHSLSNLTAIIWGKLLSKLDTIDVWCGTTFIVTKGHYTSPSHNLWLLTNTDCRRLFWLIGYVWLLGYNSLDFCWLATTSDCFGLATCDFRLSG